jgi:hypothetical protein
MRSLTLVFSPFQMLNAIEARHSLQEPEDECHLIYCRGVSDLNAEQTRSMIRPEDWSSVHYIPDRESVFTLRRRSFALERIWKSIQPMDRLYLGHFGFSLGRHLANTFQPNETVVLDDGTASHRTYHNRFAETQAAGGRSVHPMKRMSVIKWLKRCLLHVDSAPPRHVTFFSIYDHPTHSCDRKIANDYQHLRTKVRGTLDQKTVYFLGGCLVELGIVSDETYERGLLAARERYIDSSVCYVPHRREATERLVRIAELTGWRVLQLPVPVELHLIEATRLPGILASFYSTALDSCHTLFSALGLKIEAHVIPESEILDVDQAEFIRTVYSYYRKHYSSGFKMVSSNGQSQT